MSLPNVDTIQFAIAHHNDDPTKLLLQSGKHPTIDMRWVAQQIEGRKQADGKWPSIAPIDTFLYPPRLNREQSSSEATARYKSQLIEGNSVADMTGGMGIDSLFLGTRVAHVTYIEQNEELFEITQENIRNLSLHNNLDIHAKYHYLNEDSMSWLSTHDTHFSTIFIDPSRRNEKGRRVSAFEDCTPNIIEHLPLLMTHCNRLIVKASPMIDIDSGIKQIGLVREVHVVAVNGECKEVLFVCSATESIAKIFCVDLNNDGTIRYQNTFTRDEEATMPILLCSQLGKFLYDPHAALLKGGAFKSICHWYGLNKLGRNTHLYTSDTLTDDFPGRIFHINEVISPTAKELKRFLPDGKCHIVCKNYHIAANELEKKLKVCEGGSNYFIATTIGSKSLGLLCDRIK